MGSSSKLLLWQRGRARDDRQENANLMEPMDFALEMVAAAWLHKRFPTMDLPEDIPHLVASLLRVTDMYTLRKANWWYRIDFKIFTYLTADRANFETLSTRMRIEFSKILDIFSDPVVRTLAIDCVRGAPCVLPVSAPEMIPAAPRDISVNPVKLAHAVLFCLIAGNGGTMSVFRNYDWETCDAALLQYIQCALTPPIPPENITKYLEGVENVDFAGNDTSGFNLGMAALLRKGFCSSALAQWFLVHNHVLQSQPIGRAIALELGVNGSMVAGRCNIPTRVIIRDYLATGSGCANLRTAAMERIAKSYGIRDDVHFREITNDVDTAVLNYTLRIPSFNKLFRDRVLNRGPDGLVDIPIPPSAGHYQGLVETTAEPYYISAIRILKWYRFARYSYFMEASSTYTEDPIVQDPDAGMEPLIPDQTSDTVATVKKYVDFVDCVNPIHNQKYKPFVVDRFFNDIGVVPANARVNRNFVLGGSEYISSSVTGDMALASIRAAKLPRLREHLSKVYSKLKKDDKVMDIFFNELSAKDYYPQIHNDIITKIRDNVNSARNAYEIICAAQEAILYEEYNPRGVAPRKRRNAMEVFGVFSFLFDNPRIPRLCQLYKDYVKSRIMEGIHFYVDPNKEYVCSETKGSPPRVMVIGPQISVGKLYEDNEDVNLTSDDFNKAQNCAIDIAIIDELEAMIPILTNMLLPKPFCGYTAKEAVVKEFKNILFNTGIWKFMGDDDNVTIVPKLEPKLGEVVRYIAKKDMIEARKVVDMIGNIRPPPCPPHKVLEEPDPAHVSVYLYAPPPACVDDLCICEKRVGCMKARFMASCSPNAINVFTQRAMKKDSICSLATQQPDSLELGLLNFEASRRLFQVGVVMPKKATPDQVLERIRRRVEDPAQLLSDLTFSEATRRVFVRRLLATHVTDAAGLELWRSFLSACSKESLATEIEAVCKEIGLQALPTLSAATSVHPLQYNVATDTQRGICP